MQRIDKGGWFSTDERLMPDDGIPASSSVVWRSRPRRSYPRIACQTGISGTLQRGSWRPLRRLSRRRSRVRVPSLPLKKVLQILRFHSLPISLASCPVRVWSTFVTRPPPQRGSLHLLRRCQRGFSCQPLFVVGLTAHSVPGQKRWKRVVTKRAVPDGYDPLNGKVGAASTMQATFWNAYKTGIVVSETEKRAWVAGGLRASGHPRDRA